MPADSRKFPGKQFEQEHAMLRLHIIVRMVDRKTIAFKEFLHRQQAPLQLGDNHFGDIGGSGKYNPVHEGLPLPDNGRKFLL